MQKRHWIALAGVALSMALPASGALAAQDGTGGPEMATPNPSLCDRELISEEDFAAFATPTGAFFSDAIDAKTNDLEIVLTYREFLRGISCRATQGSQVRSDASVPRPPLTCCN